ncbi:TrmO family methyltransferase [Fluviibacterium sp. DFM31]|uniref:TrmO family methyltransferase n=1 Tax=Meridianimarinicoccus marinus TaxID=3231483 RepID=A0ABV3L766_9RHOB
MANPVRPGEKTLDFDPGDRAEAGLTFIGRIRTPWSRGDCPKNIRLARDSGQPAHIEMDTAYLDGLTGLEPGRALILIYWMDRARRDLILQSPGHVNGPRGTFAIRSPNRPNTLALSTVVLTGIDPATGRLDIDAIDCFDQTPLVDLRPWLPTIDVPPALQDKLG